MHIAAVEAISGAEFPPSLLCATLSTPRRRRLSDVVMIGRTHLQDATPLTAGPDDLRLGGAGCRSCLDGIGQSLAMLYPLAIGGTAVGTGLNAPARFAEVASRGRLGEGTGKPFVSAGNNRLVFHARGEGWEDRGREYPEGAGSNIRRIFGPSCETAAIEFAVTGTNGKTTTTYLIKQLLESDAPSMMGKVHGPDWAQLNTWWVERNIPRHTQRRNLSNCTGFSRQWSRKAAPTLLWKCRRIRCIRIACIGLEFAAAIFTNLTPRTISIITARWKTIFRQRKFFLTACRFQTGRSRTATIPPG